MSFGFYKHGQGYWTRLMSAIGGGVLVAASAAWLYRQLAAVRIPTNADGTPAFQREYLQGGAAAVTLLIGAIIVFWLVYTNRRSGEFLISTEGEMKKVNWSTRREIIGSAWVVIAISLVIAVILLVVDVTFASIFSKIGLLERG